MERGKKAAAHTAAPLLPALFFPALHTNKIMLSAAAETSLTSATLKLDEASFVTAVKIKKHKMLQPTNVSFTRTNN